MQPDSLPRSGGDGMDDYRAYICPDCGGQVRGLGLCREHDPPGHPVETMMVPKAEVIVLRERLRRAVEENERLRNLIREAHASLASGRGVEALEYLRTAPRPTGGR